MFCFFEVGLSFPSGKIWSVATNKVLKCHMLDVMPPMRNFRLFEAVYAAVAPTSFPCERHCFIFPGRRIHISTAQRIISPFSYALKAPKMCLSCDRGHQLIPQLGDTTRRGKFSRTRSCIFRAQWQITSETRKFCGVFAIFRWALRGKETK